MLRPRRKTEIICHCWSLAGAGSEGAGAARPEGAGAAGPERAGAVGSKTAATLGAAGVTKVTQWVITGSITNGRRHENSVARTQI